MIEPAARCRSCSRDVCSEELTTWSRERGTAWWFWQTLGDCDNCTEAENTLAVMIEEEEELHHEC